MALVPRKPVPALSLDTTSGRRVTLADLVRPDGTLYWGNVSTMPFARPHFDEIISAIDFAVKNDYPARGEA
jgi:hypothetical protein